MCTSWNNDLEFQLLENYKKESVIWNAKHPQYKERAATNEAWQRISKTMKIPVTDLKKKRNSLLSSYRKYRKIIKDSVESAAAGEGGEVYKPIWFAYSYIHSFLGDGNKSVPKMKLNFTKKVEEPESTPDDSRDQPEDQECETYTIYESKREPTPTPPWSKRRRTDSQELEEARSHIRQAVDTLNLALNSPQEDDCDLYGRFLAGRLRRMPVQARWQFMHDVDGMYLRRHGSSSQPLRARHVSRSPSTNSFTEDTPDSADT